MILADGHRDASPAVRPTVESAALAASDLVAEVVRLTRERGARFVDLFGREDGERLQVHVLLAFDGERRWLHAQAALSLDAPELPRLSADLPVAAWFERELWSELGVRPVGHPGPTGLRLAPDWPEGLYPLRADLRWEAPVPAGQAREPELAPAPEGVVDYPLGPVRSGVVESGHYLLRTVGEEIVDMALRLFYKHRGVEHRAIGLGALHLPLLAERISGTDAFAESLAACAALEALAGVEPPPRANALRTLFAELERLYNHLGYQADLCQATGLVVGQAQLDILRERVLRLNAAVSGHRYLFGLNVPGGLGRDLGPEDLRLVGRTAGAIAREVDALASLLFASSSHVDRLEGTGILPVGEADAHATVGPVGRASGQDRDARRDHPYAAYEDVDLAVPIERAGDALARARVRLAETFEALRIVEDLVDRVPDGPVRVRVEHLPANRSGLGWAESARGETVHWVLTDAEGRVRRYRARPGSFVNWQAFPLAVPGHNILTDFPIIEQSFGLSYAGNDR